MGMSASEDAFADIFAIPDFWRSPDFPGSPLMPDGSTGGLFDLRLDIEHGYKGKSLAQPLPKQQDGFFNPPLGLGLEPPVFTISELESTQESLVAPDDIAEDPWLVLDDDGSLPPELKSWDSFLTAEDPKSNKTTAVGANTSFITEGGPAAFDQLLATGQVASQTGPGPANYDAAVIDPTGFVSCLLMLSLGRGSLLFSWDAKRRSFIKTTGPVRLSGYTLETLSGITSICLDCGNNTRFLRSFVEKSYGAHATPSKVALATVVDRLVGAVQSGLGTRGRSVRSVIQLQAVVRPVASIISFFRKLVVKLSRCKTDEELLSLLVQEAHTAEYGESLVRDALREVLKVVSMPWMDFVEGWIGLQPESGFPLSKDGTGKGFVKTEKTIYGEGLGFELDEADFFLDGEKMPSFMPEDIVQPLFEAGRNIRFIWSHHPEHPLSRPETIAASQPPRLEWQFEWESISRVEQKASAYEKALAESIRNMVKPDSGRKEKRGRGGLDKSRATSTAPRTTRFELQFFGRDEKQIKDQLLASIEELNKPIISQPAADDHLTCIIQDQLFPTGEKDSLLPLLPPDRLNPQADLKTPHWSLIPLLSFGPVILAQSRLVNRECMRLLFSAHRLRAHLGLQREFHLLGNGIFCSRLSHALFDPEMDTAERATGRALGGGGQEMGLRLGGGGRDSWPPASSELRLALMDILADSYHAPPPPSAPPPLLTRRAEGEECRGHKRRRVVHVEDCAQPSPRSTSSPLPGDLSFAVRELSPAEMERCMDPDSIEALDFLRLSYKPPPALAPIMTPPIMAKYDRVFRHLLRVLRMLFVADQLFRGARPQRRHHRHRRGDLFGGGDHSSAAAAAAAQRFRFEAHHFLSAVAAYFLGTGVAGPWRRFEAWLDRVERGVVVSDDGAGSSKAAGADADADHHHHHHYGPEQLRRRHDEVLDEITFALLLRKRQQPVLTLLGEIFTLVLRFAKAEAEAAGSSASSSSSSSPPPAGAGVDARPLYGEFRKKVDVFITVCRGMSEKAGYGTNSVRSGAGQENDIERLLVALDMSNYYSRQRGS